MGSSYWVRNPDGPFAILAMVIMRYASPAASQEDRTKLESMASGEHLKSMRVLRAELHAALRDRGRLPDDELFRSAQFSQAALRSLWSDLYGDEPDARTADELEGLLKQREAERTARRATAAEASPAGVAVAPPCAECGEEYARVDVIPPGQLPEKFHEWTFREQALHVLVRDFSQWYLIFKGIAAQGESVISAERAAMITAAFLPPLTYARVHTAGFEDDEAGFCVKCEVPYCFRHWHVTSSGYGRCPRGHGQSLDPYWFPEELSGVLVSRLAVGKTLVAPVLAELVVMQPPQLVRIVVKAIGGLAHLGEVLAVIAGGCLFLSSFADDVQLLAAKFGHSGQYFLKIHRTPPCWSPAAQRKPTMPLVRHSGGILCHRRVGGGVVGGMVCSAAIAVDSRRYGPISRPASAPTSAEAHGTR
jgi:hypothetical protein